ncbi:MAG: electron transfer flavoprotein subunit alpha/FixB family protein [Bacillota bacterium]|nr:electron transfer flavoprotein subunit alpha/FixB family protein [Bacillota bacterium]
MKKIMIFDQGNPVCRQLLEKAGSLFGDGAEYIMVRVRENHNVAIEALEHVIGEERPELVLIGATALGEEVAPALGVRLGTGAAAHCVDIKICEDGKTAFMVPAFGGKVIGEIFIPDAGPGRPAIATVKPGTFEERESKRKCRIIDIDHEITKGMNFPAAGRGGSFSLTGRERRKHSAGDLSKAQLIFCGGYGTGSRENWQKIEKLAEKFGGAAGCTRPVVDMGWGPDEDSMIGTSGRTVKPKVYIGFGISGAAHHICGIKDADIIISINNDKNAEVFAASDYTGVFDAEAVIDALLGEENI